MSYTHPVTPAVQNSNQPLKTQTSGQSSQTKTTATNTTSNMPKYEVFMRKFCHRHHVPYGSEECRKVFLKEWARQSLQSGKEHSREGFRQLDEAMKKGSRKAGEVWGEYYREFKRGAKEGYKKK